MSSTSWACAKAAFHSSVLIFLLCFLAFKRFEDMQMLRHTRTLGIVQVDESVWKKLSQEEKVEIEKICDEKLESYYERLK